MTKNQPHIIALDLDGTLLRDDKTISDRTLQTIKKVKELGHVVVISTGRPYRASKIYYQQLKLDTPIVNFNGAYLHHPKDKSFTDVHSPMDLKLAKNIIKACEERNVHNILAEVIDDVYIHVYDETILEIVSLGNPIIQTGPLFDSLTESPTSILIHPKEEDTDDLRAYLTGEFGVQIDHRKWGAPWHVIEVVKGGINKAVGLNKIAEHYQIPTERIISFGDEDNDLEMIDFAGSGIAMGNAIDQLKLICDEVTKTNEEDGVACYLEQRFGIKP